MFLLSFCHVAGARYTAGCYCLTVLDIGRWAQSDERSSGPYCRPASCGLQRGIALMRCAHNKDKHFLLGASVTLGCSPSLSRSPSLPPSLLDGARRRKEKWLYCPTTNAFAVLGRRWRLVGRKQGRWQLGPESLERAAVGEERVLARRLTGGSCSGMSKERCSPARRKTAPACVPRQKLFPTLLVVIDNRRERVCLLACCSGASLAGASYRSCCIQWLLYTQRCLAPPKFSPGQRWRRARMTPRRRELGFPACGAGFLRRQRPGRCRCCS